jgi:hypothetical protein
MVVISDFLFSKFDKQIRGYTFCYKITKTNSLIFMHLNGITPSKIYSKCYWYIL